MVFRTICLSKQDFVKLEGYNVVFYFKHNTPPKSYSCKTKLERLANVKTLHIGQ